MTALLWSCSVTSCRAPHPVLCRQLFPMGFLPRSGCQSFRPVVTSCSHPTLFVAHVAGCDMACVVPQYWGAHQAFVCARLCANDDVGSSCVLRWTPTLDEQPASSVVHSRAHTRPGLAPLCWGTAQAGSPPATERLATVCACHLQCGFAGCCRLKCWTSRC